MTNSGGTTENDSQTQYFLEQLDDGLLDLSVPNPYAPGLSPGLSFLSPKQEDWQSVEWQGDTSRQPYFDQNSDILGPFLPLDSYSPEAEL